MMSDVSVGSNKKVIRKTIKYLSRHGTNKIKDNQIMINEMKEIISVQDVKRSPLPLIIRPDFYSMAHAIGIDLGITFSAIACYKNDRADIIPDQLGQRLIPSLVYVDPKTGEKYVGKVADDLSPQCPQNLLRDAKRILGRKFDDETVTKWIQSQERMYSLASDENEKAAFEVTVSNKKVIIKPEEVSAEIFKHLKKMAEDYIGTNITEAVISIPAYFSNSQRTATKKAAELAGLNVIKLITEPIAAAIQYIKDQNLVSKLMVFDWGGGTLDITFIEVNKDKLEVKAVYGDSLLGGRNVDEALIKHFFVSVENHRAKFMRRLLEKCISLKEHLTTKERFVESIDCYDGENDLSLELDRKKFEEINESIFERAMDIVKYGLSDVGYTVADIDHVVLVGGSTRIPKIRKMLNSLFGENKIKINLNPDEAVAAGACIKAALLKLASKNANHSSSTADTPRTEISNWFATPPRKYNNELTYMKLEELAKLKITEVTPLSLGIEICGNLFNTFIQRNTKLPVSNTLEFQTAENNQTSVEIIIYEGERKNCKYNNKLTCLTLDGLPQKRAGDVMVLITFNLNEDGILTVSASEQSTHKSNQLSVTMSEFRLSESIIKYKVDEAEAMKNEDAVFENFVKFRNNLILECRRILFDVNKIRSVIDRKYVENECKRFISFAESLDFTEREKLETKFNDFCNSLFSILDEYDMSKLCYI